MDGTTSSRTGRIQPGPHCADVDRQLVAMETVTETETNDGKRRHRSTRRSAKRQELQAGLEWERRYIRENEAKLRAVSQRVGSYSEFRNLVLTCHLKPLEKKDKDGALRKQPWNPVVSGNK